MENHNKNRNRRCSHTNTTEQKKKFKLMQLFKKKNCSKQNEKQLKKNVHN